MTCSEAPVVKDIQEEGHNLIDFITNNDITYLKFLTSKSNYNFPHII